MSAPVNPDIDESDDPEDLTASDVNLDHEVVRQTLEELTSVYSLTDTKVPIRFGDQNSAASDGSHINIDPSVLHRFDPEIKGANNLRALDDIVAHEMAHINWSNLRSKEKFSREYVFYAGMAGYVCNILEDEFVDAERQRTWYGMRYKHSYGRWLAANTESMRPDVMEVLDEHGLPNALLAAFQQHAAYNRVRVDDPDAELPNEIQEFVERADPIIKRVRSERDPDKRYKLFHVAMRLFMEYLDDIGEEFDVEAFEVSGGGSAVGGITPDKIIVTPEKAESEPDRAEEGPDDEVVDDLFDGLDSDVEIEVMGDMTLEITDDTDEIDVSDGDGADITVNGEVTVVDHRDHSRWVNLVKQLNEYDLNIEQRKRERDDRIETGTDNYGRRVRTRKNYRDIKEMAERRGIIRDLEDGFRELVSRPTPQPAESGPQIDMPNVVRRVAGDHTVTELFEEEVVAEVGDRCIGLATDISGSMGSDMTNLKIACAAIAKATEIIGDEFVWEAFTDYEDGETAEERLDLRIVTGPDEDFKWRHLDSIGSSSNEPTCAGIRDCRLLMEETTAREYVMIVITDGSAMIGENGRRTDDAVAQAREAVEECRRDGIQVIGLGFSGMNHKAMTETFGGRSYRLTKINSLTRDILDLYREQLHTTD